LLPRGSLPNNSALSFPQRLFSKNCIGGARFAQLDGSRCGMMSRGYFVNIRLSFVFTALMVIPGALLAQEKSQAPAAPPANPITASERGFYSFVSGAAIGAAQKMPEENYSFKPTPEVRSFGQLVGHVADASYMFCSQAGGEANPSKNIEKTKTSKADLVAALKDAVAYCNKAFDGMTDAKGSQMVKFMNFDLAKLTLFSINSAHTDEHYGNMVTYLRLRGIVPPTSENPPAQAPK
jgi:uncharacterized damage-inducible protein DinB